MGNIHHIICKPTLQNSKKLNKICEPLKLGFGIDTFWYYTLSDVGELAYISNNLPIAEFFYAQRLYNGHPYFKQPRLLKSGFFFSDDTATADYLHTQGRMREVINMDQIFMIMHVDDNKIEGYGFSVTQPLPSITNTVINNLSCLKKFISYFHLEAEEAIKQMKTSTINLEAECKEMFYHPTSYFDRLTPNSDPSLFLKRINPVQFERISSLSKREKECIKWLLKGFSAVKIGKKLHLSNRTVEFYIENVKNKLGCRTKQELFDLLLDYSDFLNISFY